MSLTKQDLQNIESIVDKTVTRNIKDLPTRKDAEEMLGRTESRIVAGMELLQRDTFARFEDHENRISRLEKKLGNS